METRINVFEKGQKALTPLFGITSYLKKSSLEKSLVDLVVCLSKVKNKEEAISEAEKLNLTDNHFYYSLLGNLYTGLDNKKALEQFKTALGLAKTITDKNVIRKNMEQLRSKN